jgi:hypothetical protein
MTDKPRDYSQERLRIFNAIADSIAESTDQEFVSELSEGGENVQDIAARVRQTIQRVVKRSEQQSRDVKLPSFPESVGQLRKMDWNAPINELRDFLDVILNRMPQYKGIVTVHCRDFKELPDAEVRSIVKQLQELGVLDKL